MTPDQAVSVFCQGYCYSRSFTFPYEYVRMGDLHVMRDSSSRGPDTRNEEIVVCGIDPFEAQTQIEAYAPTKFFLCALVAEGEVVTDVKAAFKALGYRNSGSETMMYRSGPAVDPAETAFEIRRVESQAEAELVNKLSGGRQILAQDLGSDSAAMRMFYAVEEGEPIGWARSTMTAEGLTWLSNVYVVPSRRRRGVGRALMATIGRDDFGRGAQGSVTLASKQGRGLYAAAGYQELGTLLIFNRTRSI